MVLNPSFKRSAMVPTAPQAPSARFPILSFWQTIFSKGAVSGVGAPKGLSPYTGKSGSARNSQGTTFMEQGVHILQFTLMRQIGALTI